MLICQVIFCFFDYFIKVSICLIALEFAEIVGKIISAESSAVWLAVSATTTENEAPLNKDTISLPESTHKTSLFFK